MRPSEKQLKFMEWEMGMFFHFGIRTFNHGHRDWDNKVMDINTFNPKSLNCLQWVGVAKQLGCKYAILTTKHHDGFALWPSKYTEYSVKNTNWKNGKGDVVQEFVDACRKSNIAVGLYYSPAQWGSSATLFENEEEYDDYFINQITELLSNYGKIDYLWFDGCGSGNHKYNQKRIIDVIRGLQKDIIIFGMWDPDTSWVGNEDGYAQLFNPCEGYYEFLGEKRLSFMPLECDCKLHGLWFYDPTLSYQIKSIDELIGMYELSVGRSANLLLNIGPDDNGLITQEDIDQIKKFREEIDSRYSKPLPFEEMENNDGEYYIQYSDKTLNNVFKDTENIPLVRSVIIEEDISDGLKCRKFKLYAHIPSRNPISEKRICVYYGETIGRKCICRFQAIRAPKLSLVVEESVGECKISEIKAYK